MYRFAHEAMACTFEIVTDYLDKEYACQAAAAAFLEVDRLEHELSRFIDYSDISQINAMRPGEWRKVGSAALDCLLLSQQIHADTGGAFDVTVGGILHAVKEAGLGQAAVGMNLLEISREHRAVGLRGGRVSIDLGAIGKGYAVDAAAAVLQEWSIDHAIVHSGQSTALAVGTDPARAAWPLAIRDPENHDATLFRVGLPAGHAIAGSGVKLHGHHIIDPRSGQPVTGRLGTWAVAPTAALADAISTAFMVMTPAEIDSYCNNHGDIGGMILQSGDETKAPQRFGVCPLPLLE